MNEPTVQLEHVTEIGDGGPKTKKNVETKIKKDDWRRELIDIERERVEALKSIAESQRNKTNTFEILTSAIVK